MSTENKIFKMSLDVSNLISNYKKAIQTMSDIGGPTKSIASFENTLKKLEREFDQLSKKGREGIGQDPSSVQNYAKAVEKAYKALANLGDEISKTGKNTGAFNIDAVKNLKKEIDSLAKQTKSFQATFANDLKNIGIGPDMAKTMAQEVNTEQKLINSLKQELEVRKQLYQQAQKNYKDYYEKEATAAASSVSGVISSANKTSKGLSAAAFSRLSNLESFITDNGTTKIEASNFNRYIQELNSLITKGVQTGQSFETIWNGVVSHLREATNLASEQEIFADSELVKNLIKNATLRRENARISPAATTVSNLKGEVQDLTRIASEVEAGNHALNTSYKQLENSRKSLTAATGKMQIAEQADATTLKVLQQSYQGLTTQTNKQTDAFLKSAEAMKKSATQIKNTNTAISKFAHMVGSMFSIYTIFAAIRSEIRKTYEDIKTLDKSFASIAMVTNKTVSGMWETYEQYANMASELGQKTNSVIEASALFYQQGLDTNEALSLTTDTMKLATLAGENYKTATEEMTAAIRGFRMEMTEGAHVTDVYSTLAAGAAASVNDIASAMSRTASLANSAGASFENTSAFLTKMIETTQESAEN